MPYIFDCRYFIHMCGFPPSLLVQPIYRGFIPSLCLTLLTLFPSFIHIHASVPSFLPTRMVLFCNVLPIKTQCHLLYQHFISFQCFAKSYDFVSSCLCYLALLTVLSVTLTSDDCVKFVINPYPTAFPYGNGMVLHFYQQQESSTTKTVHKVINKGLKTYV